MVKDLPQVITIDGPAGAGKSTVAKELAHRLDVFYLDTGAMYRALTLKAIRSGMNLEDASGLVDLARRTRIGWRTITAARKSSWTART